MIKEIVDLNLQNMIYRGCAEQETIQQDVFMQLLKKIDNNSPCMVELGCCDAFYSIVFNKFFNDRNPTNFCVEISEEFLNIGKHNIKNNNCKNTHVLHAGVGKLNETSFHVVCKELNTVDRMSFNDYLLKFNIEHIDLLHMDIQGTEMSILKEMVDNKLNKKIKYAFISTHNADGIFGPSHDACLEILQSVETKTYFENKHEGGVGDGLIVVEFL